MNAITNNQGANVAPFAISRVQHILKLLILQRMETGKPARILVWWRDALGLHSIGFMDDDYDEYCIANSNFPEPLTLELKDLP